LAHGKFDVVLVWASDRIARSVKHFLEVLDELNRIGVEYISFREQIDTGGPLGRALVVIIGVIAKLRSLIIEWVRTDMRRARHYLDTTSCLPRHHSPHPAGENLLRTGCIKRVLKIPSLTHTKSTAGSQRSGCSKKRGLWHQRPG
jgi:hypothetical protein